LGTSAEFTSEAFRVPVAHGLGYTLMLGYRRLLVFVENPLSLAKR